MGTGRERLNRHRTFYETVAELIEFCDEFRVGGRTESVSAFGMANSDMPYRGPPLRYAAPHALGPIPSK